MRPSQLRRSGLVLSIALLWLVGCDSFDFHRVLGAPSASAGGSANAAPKAPPARATSAAAARERADRVVVVAAGDIALGGNVRSFIDADKSYDPLAGLRPVLDDADLRVANLISPISDKPAAAGRLVTPVGPPGAAAALARARLGFLSVGNDELWSSGEGPFDDTLANLSRAGIAVAGANRDVAKTDAPAELHVRGWSIAVFAVTDWPDKDAASKEGRHRVADASPDRLAVAVKAARSSNDLVLVSYHGGTASGESPSDAQIAVAHAAIAAGADAVFEHGARAPLGVGWVSGRPVFYGLGNLVAEEDPKDPWTARSFFARVAFSQSGAEVDACPYLIVDGEPKLLAGTTRPEEEGIFERAIARLSNGIGGTDVGEPDLHSCMRLGPPGQKPVSDSSAPQ